MQVEISLPTSEEKPNKEKEDFQQSATCLKFTRSRYCYKTDLRPHPEAQSFLASSSVIDDVQAPRPQNQIPFF